MANKIYYTNIEYKYDIRSAFGSQDSVGADPETYKALFDQAKKKFDKSNKPNSDMMFVQIKSTHFGYVNNNNALYDTNTGKASAATFCSPFNKPILLNHDQYSDPFGRVVNASFVPFDVSMSQAKDIKTPKGVVIAHGYVPSKDAIERISDGRFLTVSVGFNAKDVKCSICGNEPYSDDCSHYRGEQYDGKTCYYIMGNLDYREVSFVNVPADQGKSHFAGITNYEIVCNNEDELKDKDYIIKNMLTSKEQTVIHDNSGISLFLAQDSNGHTPRGKAVFVFSSSDSMNSASLINNTWAKDLQLADSGLYLPFTNASSSTDEEDSSTLTSEIVQTQTDEEQTDTNTKPGKESTMEVDFSKISCADALDKVPGLKDHLSSLAAKMHTDSVRAAEDAKNILAAKDAEIAAIKAASDKIEASAKELALDSIMTMSAQLEKPQYMALLAAHKDNQEELSKSIKSMRDNYASRDLTSLQYTVADLKVELDLKKAADAKAAEAAKTAAADAEKKTIADKPAGDGITTTTDSAAPAENNTTETDNSKTGFGYTLG